MFLHPHIPETSPNTGIFFKAICNFLEPTGSKNPIIYSILSFGLLFIQAVFLTRFMNNQRMTGRVSYFPGMAYIMITSLFAEWNYFSAPLIVNTILLFILSALFSIYHQGSAKGRIYNIGLALGVASFIYFPSITFLIWILLAIMVMRPFSIHEWILCIVGVTTPFYFLAVYLFITGEWSWQNLLPEFSISLPSVKQSAWLAGSVFLLTFPFLAGGYYVQESLRRMLIQVRKGWSIVLLYLLGAIFVPFVNNSHSFENWVIVCIPFAAFHACTYLYAKQKTALAFLFWITVAFILSYQYYGPGW